jgi:subtilisin
MLFRSKYFSLPVFLVFICCSLSTAALGAQHSVIIGFHKQPGLTDKALIHNAGGGVHRAYHLINAIAAKIPEHALASLHRNPHIAYVEQDATFTAIEPAAAGSVEYKNSWGVEHIGCEAIHDANIKGSGVDVAVIDTGIDYTHEDLAGNYVGGYDFVFDDDDPFDDNGHGTHVAGIIAAGENGFGVIGVAPEASLHAVKVLDGAGFGSLSDIIAGIEWAVDNNMDIANMSFAGNYSQALQEVCDAAGNEGLLLVAAAGNTYGQAVIYPAAYDSVIAVTGTDKADNSTSFSPLGPQVELAAPALLIYSTSEDGGYAELSGTSQAAPHISGTAALMMSYGVEDLNGDGVTNNQDVRQKLQETAKDLGIPGRDETYGYGLVDAAAAVMPAVVIDSATCKDGIVNITGSGFGQYVDPASSDTGVYMTTTTTEAGTIISWNDTVIVADFGECVSGSTIEVVSVFGSASAEVVVKKLIKRPLRRPPRR